MLNKKTKILTIVTAIVLILVLIFCVLISCIYLYKQFLRKPIVTDYSATNSNWIPYENNPIIGNESTGTLFDPHIIKVEDKFLMYVSTRKDGNIGVTESDDGIEWSEIKTVLLCDKSSGWENIVNRCSVVFKDSKYYMYYTGQQNGISRIGVALSDDGYNFVKEKDCILSPEYKWEGYSVMNPFVTFDNEENVFKMWYSAGETYEPDVICYAESMDGIHFDKYNYNPIFIKGTESYDCAKVSVGHVIKKDEKYVMFYIGYQNVNKAYVCYATSTDGKTNWTRSKHNPIIVPVKGTYANDAVYKPTIVFNENTNQWMLYCNGRDANKEYIGLYRISAEKFTLD